MPNFGEIGARALDVSTTPPKPNFRPEQPTRISSWSNRSVTIDNLDTESFQGVMAGCYWMGVNEGRVEFLDRRRPLPKKVDDEQLLPFWKGRHRHKLVSFQDPGFSFSIIIQHLCGYNYTPAGYEREAKKLKRWGFRCMRSRRGKDGRYWEMWMLPGLYAARGRFGKYSKRYEREFLEKEKRRKVIRRVVRWLCRNVSFGSLDVTSQAAAMVMAD